MKKKVIAIALSLLCSPVALPQNSRAQVVESVVGGSACAASVGCGVIVGIVFLGGVGYYVLNANGRKYRVHPTQMEIHREPIPQAGPRPEFRQQGESFYNPAIEEFTLANNRSGCHEKEKRVKKEHPEWDVWLASIKRNRSPGTFNEALCIWQGRHRKLLKRYYNS